MIMSCPKSLFSSFFELAGKAYPPSPGGLPLAFSSEPHFERGRQVRVCLHSLQKPPHLVGNQALAHPRTHMHTIHT